MSFDAQMKFAGRMAKKRKITVKQLPMQTEIDLPLSKEMNQWLGSMMSSTDDGYLDEMVSNPLAKPLDAMSLYTPLGAIASSQFAAVRPEESTNEREDRELRERKSRRLRATSSTFPYNSTNSSAELYPHDDGDGAEELSLPTSVDNGSFNTAINTTAASVTSASTTWSSQRAIENRPKPMLVDDALKRLEVMWLNRRAKIEMDAGQSDAAFKTLNDALEIHLGTSDYSKADLGSHVHKEPEGLLDYIANTYFDYDKTAHIDAGRIQRCFLRWMKRRARWAVLIQKFFRGYLQRKGMWLKKNMQKQTATIIQRAYRRYLAWKCVNATRIKMWYLKLKMMEDFKGKLYYYRNAYRIQRLWRGYGGRMVAAHKRKELNSTSLVQRQSRAWRARHQRTLAIKLIHRRYHFAARLIQCLWRRTLAIKRCQLQLLKEMLREEERMERESGVVDEGIKIQLKKVQLYMETAAGKVHFRATQERIRAKDKHFKATKKTLDEDAVMAHEAMVAFELFDTDGSGQIDEDELANMLVQLAIPMDQEGVTRLANEIDLDGSGDIDFGEFLDWYTGGGSQDVVDGQTNQEKLFKQILKARTYILEITGVILQKRTTRDMLRQVTTWQSKDLAATFRNTFAPKFQCCQCMAPFVFFADYQAHFDRKSRCIATKEKAIYYNKYWVVRDWNYQRQIEKEIRRLNDEIPNINYSSLVATFKDIALMQNAGVHNLMTNYIKRAQVIYLMKFHDNENGKGDNKTMGEEILDVVNICGDGHLNPLVALTVAEIIGEQVPNEWVVEDRWDMEEFTDWLLDVVDKGVALRSPPAYTKCLNQEKEKLKQDTWLLGTVYVRVLRLMQVATESSLIALMECRTRRPRTMTIPDKELLSQGLDHLTKKAFNKAKNIIVEKLSIVKAAIEKLTTIYVPSTCERLMKRTTGTVAVGPDGKLTEAELRKILIGDAHVRAYAQFQNRAGSSIGRTQIRRLANELWATRIYHRKIGKEISKKQGMPCLTMSDAKRAGDILYLYERYSNAATGDGIETWELELVQKALSIRVPDAKWPEVNAALDPGRTGFVSFKHLFKWIMDSSHKKYFHFKQAAGNMLEYVLWTIVDTIYMLHAEQMLLTSIRKISRLELDYQNLSLEALLLQAKLPDDEDPETAETTESKPLTSSEELAQAEEESYLTENEKEMKKKATEIELERKTRQLEADKARIEQLRLESELLNEKIVKIKNADEIGESLLLFKLQETEAEERCRRNFFSRQGVYNLRTEMRIMGATNKIIEAYGFCISPGARYPWTSKVFGTQSLQISQKDKDIWIAIRDRNYGNATEGTPTLPPTTENSDESIHTFDSDYEVGWALSLAVLVYAYDTDCSGSFDEGEVKLLLSNSLCGMSERKVLLNFPEVKEDSATLHTMVNYLAPKVIWGRGWLGRLGYRGSTFVLTKPSLNAAASMLVSLSRQYAREKAEETAELARSGQIKEEDDA